MSKEDVANAVSSMISRGDTNFVEAIKRSPEFRAAVNDAFAEKVTKDNPFRFFVDKAGRLRSSVVDVGDSPFYKFFLSPAMRAEGSNVAREFFEQINLSKRKVVKPTFDKGKLAEAGSASLETYAIAVREAIQKFLTKNRKAISLEDAKKVARVAFGETNSAGKKKVMNEDMFG